MDSPFEPRLPSGREKRIGVSLNSVASHQFENPTPPLAVTVPTGSRTLLLPWLQRGASGVPWPWPAWTITGATTA